MSDLNDMAAGFYKAAAGLWVVNAIGGRRLGLVVRDGRMWHAECDRGCDLFNVVGRREGFEAYLYRHWKDDHGWEPNGQVSTDDD